MDKLSRRPAKSLRNEHRVGLYCLCAISTLHLLTACTPPAAPNTGREASAQSEASAARLLEITFEEGYTRLPGDVKELKIYEGTLVDTRTWSPALSELLFGADGNSLQHEEDEEAGYLSVSDEDGLLSLSKEGWAFYAVDKAHQLLDFIQIGGRNDTLHFFEDENAAEEEGAKEAIERVKEIKTALFYREEAQYKVFKITNESLASAQKVLAQAGWNLDLPEGDRAYYLLSCQPLKDGLPIWQSEDTWLGGPDELINRAILSEKELLMLEMRHLCTWTEKESVQLIEPQAVEAALIDKYTDVIATGDRANIRIYKMELGWYASPAPRNDTVVQLVPVYSFTITSQDGDPASRVLYDAVSGKEILT